MSVESRLTDVEETLRNLRGANRLQGRRMSAAAPIDNELLGWNDTTKKWEPKGKAILALPGAVEFDEITAPGAGAANKLRLYALDGPDTSTGGHASVLTTVDSAGAEIIFDAGLYTPTIAHDTNVAASTAHECHWMRIGDIVTVSGKVDVDPTLGTATTILTMTLPVASNFTNTDDAGGTCNQSTVSSLSAGCMRANVAADTVQMLMHPLNAANAGWHFIYQYHIL